MSTEGATQWRQERRLEQEQKAKQLQDALETASTPEDRAAAAQAIYGPSVFKQHAENLFGRLIGRTPQPVVSPYAAPSVTTPASVSPVPVDPGLGDSGATTAGQPAPTKAAPSIGDDSQLPSLPSPATAFTTPAVTVQGPAPHSRAQALAGVMARGTTENQRALALHAGELAQGNEAQLAGLTAKEAAFQKLAAGKSPAEQRQIAMLFGMQPRMTQREYTNPETGERQWLYPDEAQDMGWTATMGSGVPKLSDFTDAQGNTYKGTERDGKFYDASGTLHPDAKPFIKPAALMGGMVGQWLRENPGKTVTDYMRLQASLKPVFPRIQPVNDAQGNVLGYTTATATGGGTRMSFTPFSSVPGMPQDLGEAPGVMPPKPTNTVLTQSQRAQMIQPEVEDTVAKIESLRDQLGPLAGRWNDVMTGRVGADNPAVASLQMQLKMFTTALMLAHGLRGQAYQKSLQEYLSASQSPDNLIARIRASDAYLNQYSAATGHGPAPKTSSADTNASGGRAIVQKSKKTGAFRYSLDGGQTWHSGQPPK